MQNRKILITIMLLFLTITICSCKKNVDEVSSTDNVSIGENLVEEKDDEYYDSLINDIKPNKEIEEKKDDIEIVDPDEEEDENN